MVDRIYFSAEEKEKVLALREKLSARDHWIPARLGLARSLQIAEAPDPVAFKTLSKQEDGIELHARQMTGEGADDPDEDFTDVFRALLSMYEGRDFFSDERAFHDALQRHVRRGVLAIYEEWEASGSLPNYLAQELLHDTGAPTTTLGSSEDDLPDRIMRVVGELGIGAALEAVDRGPRLTRLTLQLHGFDDFERLRRAEENIIFALGLETKSLSVSLASEERRAHLTVPRPRATWRTILWAELRGALRSDAAKAMDLPIILGTDVLGNPLLIDLAAAPHLLVGGTTGSGKSMCLHALLLSVLEGAVDAAELVLIDPKEVEFSAYASSPRVRGGVKFTPQALATLDELVEEMDRRQELFKELGVRDFKDAKVSDPSLARIVVVIDELSDLMIENKAVEFPLIRLALKARFTGIHLVLATQRPEAATFSGQLRSNVPSRIALTVQKASESRIILDEQGAETLLGRGDMLVKLSAQPMVRAHGCRVDHADIQAAVKA